MGGRVGKTKNCSQTATIRGPLDAQIPAIITISAVSTAIIYIKGYKKYDNRPIKIQKHANTNQSQTRTSPG